MKYILPTGKAAIDEINNEFSFHLPSNHHDIKDCLIEALRELLNYKIKYETEINELKTDSIETKKLIKKSENLILSKKQN